MESEETPPVDSGLGYMQSAPTFEGWIEKASGGHRLSVGSRDRASSGERLSGLLGNMRTGWDKRYVVLRDRQIKYYKYQEDVAKGEEKGTFDCHDATFCMYPAQHGQRAHQMVLANSERELTLRVTECALPGNTCSACENIDFRWEPLLRCSQENFDEGGRHRP